MPKRIITWKRVGIAFLVLCLISGEYWVFALMAFAYGIYSAAKDDSARPRQLREEDSALVPLAVGYYAGRHHHHTPPSHARNSHPEVDDCEGEVDSR